MPVRIVTTAFNPFDSVQQYQQQLERDNGFAQYGATAIFVGSMRDFNVQRQVSAMTLEHYPGMTETSLEEICRQAKQKWPILDVLVVHRVGDIQPNDSIVLVAVWSAHRSAAYDANRYIMEALKSRAPFWKKETTQHGEQWVDKNT